jgi:hypothetical protein
VAIHYSGGDHGKQMPTVFKIGVGAINRGASLAFCSQYAGEVPFVIPPCVFVIPSFSLIFSLKSWFESNVCGHTVAAWLDMYLLLFGLCSKRFCSLLLVTWRWLARCRTRRRNSARYGKKHAFVTLIPTTVVFLMPDGIMSLLTMFYTVPGRKDHSSPNHS